MSDVPLWNTRLVIANAVVLFIQGACFCRLMIEARYWQASMAALSAVVLAISAANSARKREQLLYMQHGMIGAMRELADEDPEFKHRLVQKMVKQYREEV